MYLIRIIMALVWAIILLAMTIQYMQDGELGSDDGEVWTDGYTIGCFIFVTLTFLVIVQSLLPGGTQ